uniref:ret finger protein-like 4A n=1 Tax=Halichoerus grypus TaxID=9711 RepID=UPI0016596DEA|nr:ret finger protein-like 4A [Halichoerus grypus]
MILLVGGYCVTGLYKARPSALQLNFRQKSRLGEIECIMLSEISQSEKDKYHMISVTYKGILIRGRDCTLRSYERPRWTQLPEREAVVRAEKTSSGCSTQEHRDLKLTCPMCREVTESPPLKEWQIGALSLLVRQHSGLLVKSLPMSKELLRFQEVMTLDASTANPFLVLSDDLGNVWCGKICHNPVEDPQRFTYLTRVLGTACFSSGCHYWEVKVWEGKEWTLGIWRSQSTERGKVVSPLSMASGLSARRQEQSASTPSRKPEFLQALNLATQGYFQMLRWKKSSFLMLEITSSSIHTVISHVWSLCVRSSVLSCLEKVTGVLP